MGRGEEAGEPGSRGSGGGEGGKGETESSNESAQLRCRSAKSKILASFLSFANSVGKPPVFDAFSNRLVTHFNRLVTQGGTYL